MVALHDLVAQFEAFATNFQSYGSCDENTKSYKRGLLTGIRAYLDMIKNPGVIPMDPVAKAKAFAARWYSKEDMAHAKAVVDLCLSPFDSQVAWLHAIFECSKATIPDLEAAGIEDGVIACIVALHKIKAETYLDYILRIKQGNSVIRTVKMHDLEVHLKECDIPAQQAKWQMALYILGES